MANKGNQKLKLLYIMEMLEKYTDEEHPMAAPEIIRRLKLQEIEAERKSIYRDIQTLEEYGMDIVKAPGQTGYYVGTNKFELAELKLLVDAVAASKFITEKKSRELVKKIEELGSVHQGKHLHRQVVVSDRVKTANEQIYYGIDEIYQCIDNHHQLQFQYAEWNENKEQVLRRQGKIYQVSPAFLLWDSEYYYLVAYDEQAQQVRHYRVDKIRSPKEVLEPRNKKALEIEAGEYAKKRFSMFAGETQVVRLRAPKEMAGVMVDRFGQEVTMRKDGEDILVRVEVEVSAPFFGWISGLSGKVTIEGPEDIRQKYISYLQELLQQY